MRMRRSEYLKRNFYSNEGGMLVSCGAILGVILLGILLWAFAYPGLWPMSWLLHSVYTNPIAWLLPILLGVVLVLFPTARSNAGGAIFVLLEVGFSILWMFWLFLAQPVMLIGLYQNTDYQPVTSLIPLASSRAVSYAEANENFKNQNPDTRFSPGDLDYVRGHWIAEFGPNIGADFLNKLIYPSQGFFLYDPDSVDKVQIVRQQMPFAEKGVLWNSAEFFVRQHDAFSEFHEVLYVADPRGGYFGLVSLIKRTGWRRAPYVAEVGLIYADGRAEWLSPAQAQADARLQGVQLEPEWLAAKRTEAYGWRYGLLNGFITRKGRVSVQRSAINAENSPPYHLDSIQGMMWYTPFGPYRKSSLKGIMMSASNVISGPVYVWELPDDQAYQGVDALATEIKAAPNHPADVNWLRVSQGEEGEVRSGDTDVVELLPAPRQEGEKVTLYFSGFVAIDPPTRTRFFVTINAETREVLQDVYSVEEVNTWLSGQTQLVVQRRNQSAPTGPEAGGALDFESMTEEQLLDQLQAIIDELRRRGNDTPQAP